ncbi:phosphoribosylglycinamide formyltransferase [Brevibacillus dissolubilis]|uniref:phosphoribosylglycinamide formyltransferase n=1 Tax=Brevibacillus dissolubilis TaxID=1844116 RepID=UPI00159BE11F|nr:phosphoribosylglycinamide formyltransferase [Brevibacillus dissolubilis]
MKLAVFASGSGSNFEAIVKAIEEGRLSGAEVAMLICDKPGAYVLERASRLGVPAFAFDPKQYPDKAAFETEIVQKLEELGVSFIVLAGYMRLIGEVLLSHFEGRMINLHPSLLPAFPGKDAIGQALSYGVKVTGVTVHFVDAGLDTGPIIAQESVAIAQDDNHETLAARIHAVEHQLLIGTLQQITNGQVAITGRHVHIT